MADHDDALETAETAWLILDRSGGLLNRVDITRRLELSANRVWRLVEQRHIPEPVGEVGVGRPGWPRPWMPAESIRRRWVGRR